LGGRGNLKKLVDGRIWVIGIAPVELPDCGLGYLTDCLLWRCRKTLAAEVVELPTTSFSPKAQTNLIWKWVAEGKAQYTTLSPSALERWQFQCLGKHDAEKDLVSELAQRFPISSEQ
jgi:hypothetical protein